MLGFGPPQSLKFLHELYQKTHETGVPLRNMTDRVDGNQAELKEELERLDEQGLVNFYHAGGDVYQAAITPKGRQAVVDAKFGNRARRFIAWTSKEVWKYLVGGVVGFVLASVL